MEESEFLKKRFKAFEIIQFKSERIKNPDGEYGIVEDCMLVGVDYDQRLFKLLPFNDGFLQEKPFWARCEYCKRPAPKPRLVK